MEIHPIRKDADHEVALREVEQLWGAADNSPAGDGLDVLATLIEAYEDRRWPVEELDPIEAVMAHNGHSRADLAKLIGQSRATKILKRRRGLTLSMIRKISSKWRVPERVLVREYRVG